MAEGNEPRPLDGYTTNSFANTKHANITSAERAYYIKIGRVVIVQLTFTVGTNISGATTQIFSGLPRSTSIIRFRVPNTLDATKPPLRLAITTGGNITNSYSASDYIPTGTFEGTVVYISE